MKKAKITLNAFALALAILLIQGAAFAQDTKSSESSSFSKYWYLNLNGGINQFWGDVQDQTPFEKYWFDSKKLTGGITLGHQLSPIFGVRGNLSYGGVYSVVDALGEPIRYQEMEAKPLMDYSIQGTLSLSNLIGGYKDRKTDIYGFAGIGFSNWETTLKENYTALDNVIATNGGNEEASNGPLNLTTEAFIPAGIGISYKISDAVSLGIEQAVKTVNSDLLDAKKGGFDYDMYSSTTVHFGLNLSELGGYGKMVRNFGQVGLDAQPSVMERHGDEVKVKVTGQIPEDYFSSKAAMKLIPKLNYNGKTKVLEPIFLRGEKVTGDGQVITDDGGSFSKDYTIAFEEGMEDAELVMKSLVFLPKGNPVNEDATCSNILENYKSQALPQTALAEGTIITGQRVTFEPAVSSANPYEKSSTPDYGMIAKHGYEKETIISDKATTYFKINLAYLNWRLPLNVDHNAKEDVEELKQFIDNGWKIKNIEINAWASPEGEESFNSGLSERRAEKGMDVLEDLFEDLDMSMKDFTVDKHAKGEDWNGFMDAVENSDIEDKNIILNVVRSQPDLAKREQEIKNMSLIYEEVEENILPPLRRTEIQVNSYEPKKTDQEMADLAMNDAEQLDKAELLYSATLYDDLDKKLAIYKKANELFPGCAKAYNNTGYIHTLKGDYDKAKESYKKAESIAPTHGGVLNNLGVIAGIEGDYDKAEEYFTKAKKQGVNVSYSMGVLNITKGNYGEALSQMGDNNCDYNVALAHLVNGDTEKAESKLECAPESAEKEYLMAVVNARKDNKEMVFKHLVNAIKADSSLKETAKSDKEFIKYFNMPDFKSMVQ